MEKSAFEALGKEYTEVSILTDTETFIYSFLLEAKIMLDVLTDAPIKEI